MAISLPSGGSGVFVPVRVWSCSKHDSPQDHYCDCDFCEVDVLCEECEGADWVDKVDESGKVVTRERSSLEAFMYQGLMDKPLFLAPIVAKVLTEWTEDEAMPRVTPLILNSQE